MASRDAVDRGPAYDATLYDVKNLYSIPGGKVDTDTTITGNALKWVTANADVNVYSVQSGSGTGNTTYENLWDYYAERYPTLHVSCNGNISQGYNQPTAPGSSKNSLGIAWYYDGDRIPADRSLDTISTDSTRGPSAPTLTDAKWGWWHPEWGWGQLNGSQAWSDDYKTAISSVAAGSEVTCYFDATVNSWQKLTLVWKRHMAKTTAQDFFSDLDLEVYDDTTGLSLDKSSSVHDNVEQVKFAAPRIR